ncbi:MAG: phosphoribosylglycinamide formyltransferase [Firmicutes bacterium]|nr:phosphoribosylglycinamide formyltransferase [Bacillota bacterium]
MTKKRKRVAVFVSGRGSNLQALIEGIAEHGIPAEIALVVSNKPEALALERAERHGIPTAVFSPADFADQDAFADALLKRLYETEIDLICLAGFTLILPYRLLAAFPQRIINIHPSLLPAFGGKGMYGMHVHRAVLASGAKYSGATVHIVTEEIDGGPIICQEVVPVEDDDTPETLAQRVLEVEHRLYPRALQLMVEDALEINGLRTRIKQRAD